MKNQNNVVNMPSQEIHINGTTEFHDVNSARKIKGRLEGTIYIPQPMLVLAVNDFKTNGLKYWVVKHLPN